MGIKIKVDRDLCIGTGNCVDAASKTFELDEENICIVKDPTPETEGRDSDENILEAAKSCPVTAILLFDEETGEPIYPKKGG